MPTTSTSTTTALGRYISWRRSSSMLPGERWCMGRGSRRRRRSGSLNGMTASGSTRRSSRTWWTTDIWRRGNRPVRHRRRAVGAQRRDIRAGGDQIHWLCRGELCEEEAAGGICSAGRQELFGAYRARDTLFPKAEFWKDCKHPRGRQGLHLIWPGADQGADCVGKGPPADLLIKMRLLRVLEDVPIHVTGRLHYLINLKKFRYNREANSWITTELPVLYLRYPL